MTDPHHSDDHGHALDLEADPADQLAGAIVDAETALRGLLETFDGLACPHHGLDEDTLRAAAVQVAERYGHTALTGDGLLLLAAEARGRLQEVLLWPAHDDPNNGSDGDLGQNDGGGDGDA